MPKGKTKSKYSLAQRKRIAFQMYSKAANPSDVARKLGIHWDTAKRYQDEWHEKFQSEAKANPGFLRDVLSNTLKVLAENDEVRREAWRQYQKAETPAMKVMFLNTLNKTNEQRTKILGVIGVKQEFFIFVQQVQTVQEKLFQFMAKELCQGDREKLALYMETELAEYMGGPGAVEAQEVPLLASGE